MTLVEPDSRAEAAAPPPFELIRATPMAHPVVFASPHSGRFYPPSMMARSRLDARTVRGSEDALVDQLISPAQRHGVALMLATHGRAYVDVNRAADELDPGMFEAPPAGAPATRSTRVAAGLGCIARVVGQGREIYRDKLPASEAELRLHAVWRPWHAALHDLLEEARAGFGQALLIDWHSMPAAAGAQPGRRPAQIVLGDRFGAACAPAITGLVQREFEARGYLVARNAPYAGGWTTARYGRPDRGLHALQIEVSRALYLDEARLQPRPGFHALQRDVAHLAGRLVQVGAWR